MKFINDKLTVKKLKNYFNYASINEEKNSLYPLTGNQLEKTINNETRKLEKKYNKRRIIDKLIENFYNFHNNTTNKNKEKTEFKFLEEVFEIATKLKNDYYINDNEILNLIYKFENKIKFYVNGYFVGYDHKKIEKYFFQILILFLMLEPLMLTIYFQQLKEYSYNINKIDEILNAAHILAIAPYLNEIINIKLQAEKEKIC